MRFTGPARDRFQVLPGQGKDRRAVAAIAARGLEMVFLSGTERFRALKAVDFSVLEGNVQMVMGSSGAGKTTLLLVLAGLLTPTAGRVHLLGEEITRMSRQALARFRLQHMGILFPDSHLFHNLTALENVEIALELKGLRGQAARQHAHQLLEEVGLGNRVNFLPRQLSGGQQQRVAVARALAGNPQMIFADEPTASLDSENGWKVVELLRKLTKEEGGTVLIATHDHRIISLADHITYLEDGVMTEGANWVER